MGGAASVPDDRSPYQTSGSVRTKFFFKPPLNLGLRKNLSNKNLSAEVSSQSNFKKAEKDILVPIVTDYATDDEKFSKDVFERSSKIDGQHKVHMTESGRQSFMTFIKAEYAAENQWFFNAIHDTMKTLRDSKESFDEDSKNLIASYLPSGSGSITGVGVTETLKHSLSRLTINSPGLSKEQALASLSNAQDEAITTVAKGALPRYLLSTYSSESVEVTKSVSASRKTAESKGALMTSELDKVLTSSNWLREMLVAVEHIPICVTVAAASMAMPGFPLLYVNRAFESTTGYTRQEIIGQNCRFLQLGKLDGEVSEQDSINRLSYALSEAKPVRVAITNYRKDGTSFSNLLAMKPIMDEDGNYAFVLGVQCDIGSRGASAAKLKMIDDLFHLLPDTIMVFPQTDGRQ